MLATPDFPLAATFNTNPPTSKWKPHDLLRIYAKFFCISPSTVPAIEPSRHFMPTLYLKKHNTSKFFKHIPTSLHLPKNKSLTSLHLQHMAMTEATT